MLLLPLIVVSCASPNHAERAQNSQDDKTEEAIPLPVRQIRSVRVQEVRRYLWASDEVTLNFITTNYFDGARLSLLTTFAKTAKAESRVYLRLRTEQSHADYRLALGSPFCDHLASSLGFTDPTGVLRSNDFNYLLIHERVAKLRELLRGSYTHKSPPP